jgi:hypothetical protein
MEQTPSSAETGKKSSAQMAILTNSLAEKLKIKIMK